MENFSNRVLLPENLPIVEKQTFNPLDKKYLRILFIQKIIFFLILVGGFAAFLIFSGENIPALVIAIISGVLLVSILYSFLIKIVKNARSN